jgi:multidrug resistance protein, MATE family
MTLGIALFNIFVYSTVFGPGDVVTTLCGQAFGNANYPLAALYLNKAILLSLLTSIPVIIIIHLLLFLLIKLDMDSQVCDYAQTFLLLQIPHILAYYLFDLLRRYLQAIQIFHVQTIIFAINMAFLFVTCYFFIIYFDLGIYGAAFSLDVSSIFCFLMHYFYASISNKTKSTWLKFKREACSEWKEILDIAVPALLIMAVEFSYEYGAGIEIGFISITQEAVYLSIMNLHNLARSVFVGIQYSCYSLMANAIGANNFDKSQKLFNGSILVSILCFLIVCSVILGLKTQIAEIFFQDTIEINMMEEFLVYETVYLFLVSMFYCLMCYFRAHGFQKKIMIINITISGLLANTLGVILCFSFGFGLEIYGIWYSLIICRLIIIVVLSVLYFQIDWEAHTKIIFLQLSMLKN